MLRAGLIRLFIERLMGVGFTTPFAGIQCRADLAQIIDMQRPRPVERDIVGDVDQQVLGIDPDRGQTLLQPFR